MKKVFRLGKFAPDLGGHFSGDGDKIGVIECFNMMEETSGYIPAPAFATNNSFFDSVVGDPDEGGFFSYTVPVASGPNYSTNHFVQSITGGTGISMTDGSATTDVSRATGYTSYGRRGWRFTVFNKRLIATNGVDAIQSKPYDTTADFAKNNLLTTNTTADPRALFVASFKNHLFIANFDLTAGTSGGEAYGGAYGVLTAQTYPTGVWWSALDNERRFADPAVHAGLYPGSDRKIIGDSKGQITGMIATTDYIFLARERGVDVITGPPFNITSVDESASCFYPNSLVATGSNVYFMTRNGPARFTQDGKIEWIARNKVARWLLEIKDVFRLGSTSRPDIRIRGAASINGEYVYWTFIEEERDYSSVAPVYKRILSYNVVNESFAWLDGLSSRGTPASGFEIDNLLGIASVHAPIINSKWDPGDGVSILVNDGSDFSIGYLTKAARNSVSGAYVRTADIQNGDGVYWRPKRIRPIFYVDNAPYNQETDVSSNPVTYPSGITSPIDSIDVFPKRVYHGTDRNYGASPFGSSADSSTYVNIPLAQSTDDGWFNAEAGIPYSLMHSIKINMRASTRDDGHPLNSMFALYGFEMEYELGGDQGEGMELAQ